MRNRESTQLLDSPQQFLKMLCLAVRVVLISTPLNFTSGSIHGLVPIHQGSGQGPFKASPLSPTNCFRYERITCKRQWNTSSTLRKCNSKWEIGFFVLLHHALPSSQEISLILSTTTIFSDTAIITFTWQSFPCLHSVYLSHGTHPQSSTVYIHIIYFIGSEEFVYLYPALLHKAFHFSHLSLRQLEATARKPS